LFEDELQEGPYLLGATYSVVKGIWAQHFPDYNCAALMVQLRAGFDDYTLQRKGAILP